MTAQHTLGYGEYNELQAQPVHVPTKERELTQSAEIDKLVTAMAKAAPKLNHPLKKNKAGSGSFSYTYADLPAVIDAIKDVYAEQGLVIIQLPSVDITIKVAGVKTIVAHSSGQFISSFVQLGLVDLKPQTIGSAITYARRYALSAMAGVASETDDDGASGKTTTYGRK